MNRILIGLTGLMALSGCGGGEAVQASLPNMVAIDGSYSGVGMREGTSQICPERLPMIFTVSNGQLAAEIRAPDDRTVTQARFESFVDNEGRVIARAWFGGTQNEVAGTFADGAFSGRASGANGCTYRLRLARVTS